MRTLLMLSPLAIAAPALAAAPPIVVEQAELRASIGNVPNTAGYMVVRNTGRQPDRLLGASCACAADVSVHETMQVNGVARMQAAPGVVVAPGQSVAFAPGGRHLMVMGLKAPIRAGDTARMVLRFEKAGSITVPFKATDTPGAGGHRH